MARKSLAELKKHLKNKSSGGNSAGFYPFTKMQEGEEVHARLLADPDEDNEEQFYIETRNHKLSINGKDKYVPCIYMYGDKCPICARSSKYYDDGNEIDGKAYYRNLNYVVRVVITKDPLPPGENGSALHTVQRLSLSKDLLQYIINGISMFQDDEAYPWDLKAGCDFIIKKGTKNIPDPKDKSKTKVVADYSASTFARRSSSLPDEVIAQLEATELPALKSLRQKHPGLDKINAMLEAHDNGTEYNETDDNASAGNQSESTGATMTSTGATTTPSTNATTETKVESTKTVTEPAKVAETVTEKIATPTETKEEVAEQDDIMARIRNRNKPK